MLTSPTSYVLLASLAVTLWAKARIAGELESPVVTLAWAVAGDVVVAGTALEVVVAVAAVDVVIVLATVGLVVALLAATKTDLLFSESQRLSMIRRIRSAIPNSNGVAE